MPHDPQPTSNQQQHQQQPHQQHSLPPIQHTPISHPPSHLPPPHHHLTHYTLHPTHPYHHSRYPVSTTTSPLYPHSIRPQPQPASYFSYHAPHPSYVPPSSTHPTSRPLAAPASHQSRYHPHPQTISQTNSQSPHTNPSLPSLPPLTRTPTYYSNPSPYIPPPAPTNPQHPNTVIPNLPPPPPLSPMPYTLPPPAPPHVTPQPPAHLHPQPLLYNNPYHHSLQPSSSTQHYQQPRPQNVEWRTHVATHTYAGYSHAPAELSDNRMELPAYYVPPDAIAHYVGPHVAPRKRRLQWTPELHAKFVSAVEELGIETAVPKLLLQAMNVPGLTRENVASHLQKYRESVRKKKLEAQRAAGSSNVEFEEISKIGDVESKKRANELELEEIERTDNKRQKTETIAQDNDVATDRELTEQEVESFARVRARVDETLQLQPSRTKRRNEESDVK